MKSLITTITIYLVCLTLWGMNAPAQAQEPVRLGAYYFPGWSISGNWEGKDPWIPIRKFPEREPAAGWYDDTNIDTVARQLDEMKAAGLYFVAVDWYWNGKSPVRGKPLEHIANLTRSGKSPLKFSILWANHEQIPRNVQEFDAMVKYWIKDLFSNPSFLRIDGRPVVFLFSNDLLEKDASRFGMTVSDLMTKAQVIAKAEGESPLFVLSNTMGGKSLKEQGYAGLSAYNHHGFNRSSHSYAELSEDYARIWQSNLSYMKDGVYVLPMIQGWDRRPWGGSQNDLLHDHSGGTPEGFRQHLTEGVKMIRKYQARTRGLGVICCWNEYGEGSVIEPTKKDKDAYLQVIRSVLSK